MSRELSEHLTPEQYRREMNLGGVSAPPKRAKRDESEAVFQARVIRLAEAAGWTVYHTHDSRRSASGFPDLVLFRPDSGVVHLWELKRRGGHPSAEQCMFLEGLDGKVVDCRLYRPEDMQEIFEVLR